MRKILVPLSVASVLVFAGCGEERESMKVTQDNQSRAYVAPGSGPGNKLGNVRVAGTGEIYITTGAKDTLTSLAKKYNTTVKWLIQRNNIKDDLPKPGTNLIVPDPNISR
jgi:hypothetical protein